MKPLKITAAEMVSRARAAIPEVETVDAKAMHGRSDVVFVDLRDVRERTRDGFIPGSFHCPRGMAEFWVDPDSPYFKPIFGEEKQFVFYCASGWRSALTTATVREMGFAATHLKDGFGGWKRDGGAVEMPQSADKIAGAA